ncbi:MAG: DUF1674 domain-containing protein [Parvibaculaceae bacterium]|nr:DUF1674 domain-containing protein [Parvibaculaceae bacterium]
MSNSNDTARSNLSALSPSPEGVTYGEVEVQPVKKMPAAAVRALAEAEERRVREDAAQEPMVKELLGQKGPEPTRYGDWEKKGLTSDF